MENGWSVIQVRNLEELDSAAAELFRLAGHETVWLFEGGMGAGKTTLIKKLCARMGVLSTVQSPTFSIVNEYVTAEDEVVYHFDFYRLKSETGAMDIGIEEYLDSGNFCFLEWPERIESLLPDRVFLVKIEVDENGERRIEASVRG